MTNPIILIVGSGPTGLVLALSLARRGVSFRLINGAKGPGEQSRAMAVHARTLEFYRQFGFVEAAVEAGIKAKTLHLRETGKNGESREVTRFDMKDLADGGTPHPFVLTFPQDDHERFLIGELKKLGIEVEWNTRLTGFTQDADVVRATILHDDGRTEEAKFDYLCGADGGHSQVRQSAGIEFAGGTYEQHFYVADVKIERGLDPDFWIDLGTRLLALMLPVRSSGMQRLIGLVPPDLNDREDLTFEDIRGQVEPLLEIKGHRGQLVFPLQGAPPRRRKFQKRPRLPAWRCRPCAQPRRRPRHEHRHRRRHQPRLEAGTGHKRPRRRFPPGQL
jgi:2-polyprenyl-6-methoxyphenol hydroxylase-like FAD-dependent oxidoreductase